MQELFAIRDTKSSYRAPFIAVNEMVARRQLSNFLLKENELSLNADDFQLFKVGAFNENTGEILSKVEFVCNLSELKNV